MKGLKDTNQQLILIIDDNKDSLNFLCDIFVDYRKAITTSGYEGIKLANNLNPDLILLDIVMPEISGYDVCKSIKDNPVTVDIPIIFLSGKTHLEDVVKGFQLGAVDYITKPFEYEELIVRVKNNLELKASRDIIKIQNDKMQLLNEELNNFLNIATHDLKNSLIVIQGFLKVILNHKDRFSEQEKLEMLKDVAMTSDSMYKILSNLLLISKLEAGTIVPQQTNFELNFLMNESINYFKTIADIKNIRIIFDNKINELNLIHDYKLIKDCFDNLLSNAIKFSPKDSLVNVIAYYQEDQKSKSQIIVIEVEDEGPGIKKSESNLLFKKFPKMSSIATNRELTTGLGLALTKMIVDLLNGSITYEPRNLKGTKFILKIPIIQ